MERLAAFWIANRNEILVTALAIVLIQLITGLGGFVKRRGGARRVEGAGFQPPPGPGNAPGGSGSERS